MGKGFSAFMNELPNDTLVTVIYVEAPRRAGHAEQIGRITFPSLINAAYELRENASQVRLLSAILHVDQGDTPVDPADLTAFFNG